MKYLKKLSAIAAVVIMTVHCAGIVRADSMESSREGSSPVIYGSAVSAAAGDVVEVTVSLQDNPGIAAIVTDISYDQDTLTLLEAKDGGLMKDAVFVKSLSMVVYPFRAIWTVGTSNISADGVLLTLVFKVDDHAKEGTYEIAIGYEEDDIYNVGLQNVYFETKNGCVSVGKSTAEKADINKDGYVNLKDARLVLRAVLMIEERYDMARMDINADGAVSLADVQIVLRKALGIG